MCDLPTPSPLQDRVLINRLDSLCVLVVSGQWPSGRRYVSEAQLNPSSEFTGDEMAYARMIRKPMAMPGGPGAEGEDGEFTVKLLKVALLLRGEERSGAERRERSVETLMVVFQEEGLKLTFSKQALMPNGSSGESSRKKHKDQEVGGRVPPRLTLRRKLQV